MGENTQFRSQYRAQFNSKTNGKRGGHSRATVRTKLKDPLAIQQVLSQALRIKGIDKQIARYKFVLHWAEIVGADIAARSKPEFIRDRTLIIRVANSVWAQELTFHKAVILSRLKPYLEKEVMVDDIMFYVG